MFDLTRVLAGPTCARTLAEHGADVLKITGAHLPNLGYQEENVVATGGEPLEHPQFASLVNALKVAKHRIEVETAGTVTPPDVPVDQWNVSLKLAHSGVAVEKRLRPETIAGFRDRNAWFKFVVATERDVAEVLEIQAAYQLASNRILLMPLGLRREEQLSRMPEVIEWCRRHRFRMGPGSARRHSCGSAPPSRASGDSRSSRPAVRSAP